MTAECIKCATGAVHPWHDDGTPADLTPYLPGGPKAPPRHVDTDEETNQ